MKKIVVALLIAVVIPSMLFASGIFGGSIGVAVMDDKSVTERIDCIKAKSFSLDDVKFGADLKLDVLFLEFDSAVFGSYDTAEKKLSSTISGTETLGVTFDIANIVKIGAGVGMGYTFDLSSKAFKIAGNDTPVTADAGIMDSVMKADILGKLSVEVLLGKLGIGASALWTPGLSINGIKEGGLESFKAVNFTDVQLGLTVAYEF